MYIVIDIVATFNATTLRPTSTPQYDQPGVMLSDLSQVSKETEAYESVKVDHEYEILDKYSQPYDEVQIPEAPPPQQEQQETSSPAAGDYELTQCPAYVPVATNDIHGKETVS